MITNDVKRIRDKLNVLKNHPETWGVICDCLKLFDDEVTERNTNIEKYVFFIEELRDKYEREIAKYEQENPTQPKLF